MNRRRPADAGAEVVTLAEVATPTEGAAPVADAAATLEEQLQKVRNDRAACEADAAAARQQLADDDWYLAAGKADVDELEHRIAVAERRSTRLAELDGRLLERIAERDAERAEEARRERYDAACARAVELATWIAEDYAKLAEAIGKGLAELVAFGSVVEAVNADRPRGAAPIALEAFRALPAGDDATHQVVDPPAETGAYAGDPAGHLALRRRSPIRLVDVVVTGRPRATPQALPAAVILPSVAYAETDFWPVRAKM